jgi:hypothetical protein
MFLRFLSKKSHLEEDIADIKRRDQKTKDFARKQIYDKNYSKKKKIF